MNETGSDEVLLTYVCEGRKQHVLLTVERSHGDVYVVARHEVVYKGTGSMRPVARPHPIKSPERLDAMDGRGTPESPFRSPLVLTCGCNREVFLPTQRIRQDMAAAEADPAKSPRVVLRAT